MEKQDLIKLLNELFIPLGFKKKGNNWVSNGETVNKIVNLQKSQYGNSFYINYGYILKSLPLKGWTSHVEDRLGSDDKVKNRRIMDLLDLENAIAPSERLPELKERINEQIIKEMQSVTTEKDVLNVLRGRRYLYTIPPFVLKHFNLEQFRETN